MTEYPGIVVPVNMNHVNEFCMVQFYFISVYPVPFLQNFGPGFEARIPGFHWYYMV